MKLGKSSPIFIFKVSDFFSIWETLVDANRCKSGGHPPGLCLTGRLFGIEVRLGQSSLESALLTPKWTPLPRVTYFSIGRSEKSECRLWLLRVAPKRGQGSTPHRILLLWTARSLSDSRLRLSKTSRRFHSLPPMLLMPRDASSQPTFHAAFPRSSTTPSS